MKQPLRRWSKPRPTMDLRRQTQRETIARLLLMGWTAERVARRMGVTARAIRYHIGTPEFESLYATLQREYLSRVDRQLGSLLQGAVDALDRMLKHSDWRAKDAAVQHILKVHGKYVDRVDLSGTLDHRSQVRHVQGELVDGAMSDEMRQKARELLSLQRAMLQRQIPARLTSRDPEDLDHDEDTGRFLPKNGHDTDESAR